MSGLGWLPSPHIELSNVTLHFPVLMAGSRSIKNEVFRSITGGRIGELGGHVIVEALKNVTASIRDGERTGLVGHNGAGKTTLLRVLNRIYAPTSGAVSVRGRVGSLINISLGIDGDATGHENIFIRSALMGIRRSEVLRQYNDIVEFADLGDFINLPVKTYSTGMTMRLAFSIATAFPADILLMDEWLATGDEGFRVKASKRIESLMARTGILVLASHSPNILRKTCNRLIWLERGEVKKDGSVDEIANAYFGNQLKQQVHSI